ncbi:hypothetical protein Tco_0039247 [Tanacetum coccineum]
MGGNLPPNGMLLSHHAQHFLPSSAHVSNGFVPTHANPYSQPSAGIINGQTLSFPFQAQTGNPSIGGTSAYPSQGGYIPQTFPNGNIPPYNGFGYPVAIPTNNYPFYTQPMYAQPNMPVCPNPYPAGLFADPTRSVTPFVRWIEDYPLPDGLKMPSHVSSYDEKGDPDNFLHLFKGAILHSIQQREGESVRAFATRYTDDTLQILGLHEDQHISGFVHGLRTRNLVKHLSTDLLSTYKGLMEKTYTWIEAREVATNRAPNDQRDNSERRSRDMYKYCYFHEDHGYDTNDCRQLKSQIEEVVKSGQLSHLVNRIKKERAKTSDSQRGEKKEKSTTPPEAPILMINQEEACTRNNTSKSPTFEGREITFPQVTKGSNSSAPVVIKAKIFGREVGRVHMDSGSSCEVIYEHCFLKLKPSIQASKVDSQVPLVGFLGKKSWAIGEVLLEITIGDTPLSRKETLNFIIGIRTVSSTHESDKIGEGVKKIRETSLANTEGVLSCTDAKEKIVVNSKYPEQTVTIGKQLPEHFKERLRNLLRTNADVFA